MSIRAGAHNLPPIRTSFVGRQRDLDQVARLLSCSATVTITGASGMGKTRLAIEVGSRLDAPDAGVWLVELAQLPPASAANQVAAAIASALSLRPQPGQSGTEALVDRLSASSLIVLLDNCEHVVAGAAQVVAELLGACPGLRVLATSQLPLGVDGEQVWPLGPLSLPAPGRSGAGSDAVALFHARATAVNGSFAVTEEGAVAVAEVCRRLDGIPLAIELAAARTTVLSPAEIADLLDERFALLTTGASDVPRQQTLEAAMAWSYSLLAPAEQALLRRLSVFAGGTALADVRAVCGGGEVAAAAVLDLLGSLVAKSLVVADTTGRRARYSLLETVRAYARQRLRETPGGAGELEELHAAWYAGLAEKAWHDGVATGRTGDHDLALDHANLHAALDWLVSGDDPQAGLEMAASLIPFWESGGHFGDGRGWLERALATAGNVPPALRVRALWGIGLMALLSGDLDDATASLRQSLAMAEEHGYHRPAAEARNLLAFISVFTSDPVAALPELEESVARARDRGDDLGLLNALLLSGRAHLFSGDTDAARRAFEECRRAGATLGLSSDARGLVGLCWVALARGEHRLAARLLAEVEPVVRRGREPFEVALVQSFAGELAWLRGDFDSAAAALDEGADLARDIGAPFPLSRCLLGLARVAAARGDLVVAARMASEASQAARRAQLAHGEVRCLHARADIARAGGDDLSARELFDEALSLATSRSDRLGRARSLRSLGTLAVQGGAYPLAAGQLLAALGLHREGGDAGGVAGTMEAMAGLAATQDRGEHAARLLGAAAQVREGAGSLRSPFDEADAAETTARARAALGVDGFDRAFAQGAELPAPEALALARRAREGRRRPDKGWAALTATERQVVALVADGLTNPEVAARLFISPRTVQGHLKNVFRKLGIASRRELRDQARRRD